MDRKLLWSTESLTEEELEQCCGRYRTFWESAERQKLSQQRVGSCPRAATQRGQNLEKDSKALMNLAKDNGEDKDKEDMIRL